MPNLIEIHDLKVHFPAPDGFAKAVDGVSYSVMAGETLGVVGESGCGKTLSALSILRLVPPPGKIAGGKIIFEERDLLTVSEEEMRKVRGKKIGMIFQEPMTALNPVFTIGDQIAEGIRLHFGASRKEAWDRAIEALRAVHISSPEQKVGDYPHRLSGGMRQRAMIAMALSLSPALLLADEPTTALDVTIQAQILELIAELKDRYSMSVILITHDLGIVAQMCERVVVMYAGRVAETAPVRAIFANPLHPYTQGLLDSVTSRRKGNGRLREIKGVVPGLMDTPPGCAFHPRCPKVMDVCRVKTPELKKAGDETETACWLY